MPTPSRAARAASETLLDEELKTTYTNIINYDATGFEILAIGKPCPRCAYVTTYMLDHDIDFKMLDVDSDEKNNQLMWDLIKLENPEIRGVALPNQLVKGHVAYNITDLKRFSTKLSAFLK